jgi:hypothetical protein
MCSDLLEILEIIYKSTPPYLVYVKLEEGSYSDFFVLSVLDRSNWFAQPVCGANSRN